MRTRHNRMPAFCGSGDRVEGKLALADAAVAS